MDHRRKPGVDRRGRLACADVAHGLRRADQPGPRRLPGHRGVYGRDRRKAFRHAILAHDAAWRSDCGRGRFAGRTVRPSTPRTLPRDRHDRAVASRRPYPSFVSRVDGGRGRHGGSNARRIRGGGRGPRRLFEHTRARRVVAIVQPEALLPVHRDRLGLHIAGLEHQSLSDRSRHDGRPRFRSRRRGIGRVSRPHQDLGVRLVELPCGRGRGGCSLTSSSTSRWNRRSIS